MVSGISKEIDDILKDVELYPDMSNLKHLFKISVKYAMIIIIAYRKSSDGVLYIDLDEWVKILDGERNDMTNKLRRLRSYCFSEIRSRSGGTFRTFLKLPSDFNEGVIRRSIDFIKKSDAN